MASWIPLTAAGRCMLGSVIALYGLGTWLGYSTLVTVAVAGLTMLLLAAAAVVVRPNIRAARDVTPDRITVGDTALSRLVVSGLTRWPVPALVVVDMVGDRAHEIQVPMIRAGGSRTLHYPLPADRRGRLRLGPLRVERHDPFGLFRRAQPHGNTSVLWVHPRVHQLSPLAVGTVPDFEGRADVSKAGTTTFATLREYVPGDDPRRIHWRSTAKTGQLIVRESVDTMEPTVSVVLDTRQSVLGPVTFEHAVEFAASVVQCTVASGRPARLRIAGQSSPPDAVSLLDRLAACARSDATDPVRLLEEIDQVAAGGALVVVTGDGEPGVLAKLAEQRRRFAPVVVMAMVGDGQPVTYRRPGMALLSARTGAEAAATWNHFVLGGIAG